MSPAPIDFEKLPRRERQIALMVGRGLANKEIACQLGLCEGTVKVYMAHLFVRVGVMSRLELALGVWRALVPEAYERLAGRLSDLGVPGGSDR